MTETPKKGRSRKPRAAAKPKDAEEETETAKAESKPKAKAKAKAKPKADSKPKVDSKAKPAAKPKAKPAAEKPAPSAPIVRASARYVRTAPRKVRLVADQVRGLQIDRARALLQFSPRSAAQDISKLIDSAAANAENNHDLVAEDLEISAITVDQGPTLKRWRPRARGRATRIDKKTCHISVALTPTD
jgi:ribosomal protein L22